MKQKHALVVDDDPIVRGPVGRVVKRAISAAGMTSLVTFHSAPSAQKALDAVMSDTEGIWFIVTDDQMPPDPESEIARGIELISRLRDVAPPIDAFIVLMSGTSTVTEAKAVGADAFLKKPFELRAFSAHILPFLARTN